MIIYQLALFVCTIVEPSLANADRYSKECIWENYGLYVNEGKCEIEGSQQHGKPMHRFYKIINSTVLIENHRCSSIRVEE